MANFHVPWTRPQQANEFLDNAAPQHRTPRTSANVQLRTASSLYTCPAIILAGAWQLTKKDPPRCPEGGGNSGDANPGSNPPPRSDGGGNSGDADPGSDPPPCPEDGGNSSDVDPGSDPSPYSDGGGSGGDMDPGSDPPLSFNPHTPPPLPLLTPAAKCAGA
jgi:hypothetical protein